MPRRAHRAAPDAVELNLAPIMNMVMILIPLLLLSVVFTKAGVIDLSSVTHSQNEERPVEEPPEEQAPTFVIHVSSDGYRIYDSDGDQRVRALAPADPGCSDDEYGPSICTAAPGELVRSLDYGRLRETMITMREHPDWRELITPRETVVRLAADPEVPFDALVATMDAVRNYDGGPDSELLFPNVALLTIAPQG